MSAVPTCPSCLWPIHGQHHVDEMGVGWHFRCWEKERPEPEPPASADDQRALLTDLEG